MTVLVATSPLDDFLNESSSTDTGELLQEIGLFGSLFGVVVGAGLVVFLVAAHRGPRREVAVILRVIAVAGGVTLVGAATELAGVAAIGDLDWTDALTDATGSAPMMRLLGGVLVLLGFFDHTVPVDDPGDADDDADPDVRWSAASASAFGLAGAVIGGLSFWFDGHTVTQGPRVVHAVANVAHVAAGSVWVGGIAGLVTVGLLRRATGRSTAPIVVRFSSIASVALVVVALAGALMTLFVIDEFGDLTGTTWGRLLLVKTAAVGITAAIGGYNHFVVVPALEREDAAAMQARARSTVAAEALLLTFVLAVTVLLTTASTN